MGIKKIILNRIAKVSEHVIKKEVTDSKSAWMYFEPEMPPKLKDKRLENKNE